MGLFPTFKKRLGKKRLGKRKGKFNLFELDDIKAIIDEEIGRAHV